MMIYLSTVVLSCFLLTVIVVSTVSAKAEESERLLEYKKRGYVWPITKFNPNTEGWSKLMQERLGQVEEIDDDAQRYKGYVTTLYPGLVINNLTEYGWGMTRISDDLLKDLQQAIRDGYDNRVGEGHTPIIEGDQAQWIERWDLMERAEEELHGVMEEWCGADLGLKMTYGLRLFQNKSSFRMHIDKKGSHAVGYVLHVDRSDDAQPWPFFIEDFHGRTHEILMTPGDVIMFESGKLMHGRPRTLYGSWYSNVVGHYHLKDEQWLSMEHQKEAEYAVPPHWAQPPPAEKKYTPLEFRGGMKEPECVDGWCRSNTETTIKWTGPGPYGSWMDPVGVMHKLVSPTVATAKKDREL